MIDTAMPSTRAAIACRIALTICPTSLETEPVHSIDTPKTFAASALPYFAGTKNGFVSAWLTNTNRQRGCGWGKRPLGGEQTARECSGRGGRRRKAQGVA